MPLTELYVSSSFAEENGRKKLQRHCTEVYVDLEETIDEQKNRNTMFREDRERHCADQGIVAESTNDLFLQARAKMSENKVTGPSEMTNTIATRENPRNHEMFSRSVDGAGRCAQVYGGL